MDKQTVISEKALTRAVEIANEPTSNPGILPPHLTELLENWNQAEREYQAVADMLDDGEPSSEMRVNLLADARARMRAAQQEYYQEYDAWAAVPAEDYIAWMDQWGLRI